MAEENESQNLDDQVVVDCATSKVSDLWKLEDCWSIWLGFLILIIGLIIYLPQGTEEVNEKINSPRYSSILTSFIYCRHTINQK